MKAKQAYLLGRTYANSTSGGGSGGAVNSVNGATGTVVLDASDILMGDGESTIEQDVTALEIAILGDGLEQEGLQARVTENESEIGNLGASVESLEEDLEGKLDIPTLIQDSSTTATIADLQDNTKYLYNNYITSLTITASSQTLAGVESTIYLTTGDSITFAPPSDIKVIGSGELSANTSYVISIQNNIMVVGEVN